MIETTYSVEKKEYIEAQSLYVSNRQKWFTYIRYAGIVCLPVFVIWNLTHEEAGAAISSIPSLTFLTIFLFFPLLLRRGFAKRFEKESKNLSDVTLQLDDESYRTSVHGVGEGSMHWGAFDTLLEGKLVFALLRGMLLYVVPKRALLPWQEEEFRAIIDRRGSHLKRIGGAK